MKLARLFLLPSLLALSTTLGGCADEASSDPAGDESDLTSLTARSRKLEFQGIVYVAQGATDAQIVGAINKQTQSAFGALREANIGVNTRELKVKDPAALAKTFVKQDVSVIDPSSAEAGTSAMTRVAYTYTDDAVVPVPLASRSAISLALLNGKYQGQSKRVLEECTSGDAHAREFENSIWYVFNPSLEKCQRAMSAEQEAIDSDRRALGEAKRTVPKREVERLYLPLTMKLGPNAQSTRATYPEYDRLYAGGVEPGKLVIGMVSGSMSDWAAGEKKATIDDAGYVMYFQGLREIFSKRPEFKFKSIEPEGDFLTYDVAGKKITLSSFDQILQMEVDRTGFPADLDYAGKRSLREQIGERLVRHWISFEAPVSASFEGKKQGLTIKLQTYFGAETSAAPHKRGIKTSDIFVYNGHSYIGYGPLDPSNFTSEDFPSSYQILMINGCVSYNYYHKDYFPLKKDGSKSLDLVTNGLESWVNESGPAMGRFVAAFIDGRLASYQDILKDAQFKGYGYSWGQDALRVVDGELDNTFDPSKRNLALGK